jgi:hypothetical protein
MNYRLLMSSALLFGCAIALQAQTPTSSQTNRTIPGEITMTGCVERADQMSAPVTAGTTVDSLLRIDSRSQGTADELRAAGTSGRS